MNERLSRTLSFGIAAFGLVSATIQIAWMGLTPSLVTLAVTLICLLFFLLFYRRSRAHRAALEAISALLKDDPADSKLAVRTVVNDAELRALWEIDNNNYGESSITFELFRSWWSTYPCGLFAITEKGRVVGGIGFWPLKEKTFRDFVEGRRREGEITARGIFGVTDTSPKTRWYFSGIVITKRLRRTQAVAALLSKSLNEWIGQLSDAQTIDIAALAYSKDGENMLQRFGFQRYRPGEETLDRLPIFGRFRVSPADIRKAVERITAHCRKVEQK